ncbi:hypothetical protein H6P81_016279 [Aristolochia fimbriata]|uniref:TTF-type domain-containing protein n=1 Tax=Aristolochia fimbriata TaxID=158543 RepID=A0AAV7E9J8_ARIFI|nr:hypothetical protein H6P81_016279 [Aristolochia fimbriata]
MERPYQPILDVYPSSGPKNHRRRFQASWFKLFHWLEYSTDKDNAYCLPCYLFTRPDGRLGSDVFITRGFDKWKKVNDGKNCAFLGHMGKDHNSQHNKAENACLDLNLMNQAYHIQNIFKKQATQEVLNNQLRLKTSVDVIRWLTFQACPFRGHDESSSSQNCGIFLEMVKLLASYNEQVSRVVLGNAPQNGKLLEMKLHAAQELESGRGLNQMTTLKRVGDTRWGSHLNSISSLIRMFNSVRSVLSDITIEGSTYAQRGDADAAYNMLNTRFSDHTMDLLILSAALYPQDRYKSFNINNICELVDKFYCDDFTEQEKHHLKYELQHYELDVPYHVDLQEVKTIGELSQKLVETGKTTIYPLFDRLLRLLLTLPVSTTTTERAFFAMSIVKTKLRNRMEDEFLRDYLIAYIEKEIAEKIHTNSIINDFSDMKERQTLFK